MEVMTNSSVSHVNSSKIGRLKTPKPARRGSIPGARRSSTDNTSTTQSGNRPLRKVSATGLSDVSESTAVDFRKAARTGLPTYQLKPIVNFSESQLKKIAQDLLELYLNDTSYEPEVCRQKTKDVSRAITDRIKKVCLTRFKVVTVVNIGNLTDYSSVNISSRSVWDAKTDKFITAEYYNKSLYAVAMVYTLYTD